jgi:hypothetical protein
MKGLDLDLVGVVLLPLEEKIEADFLIDLLLHLIVLLAMKVDRHQDDLNQREGTLVTYDLKKSCVMEWKLAM